MVLNLDIKQTAPAVAPYEEALADTFRRFDRRDDVIVASFLDSATDAFSSFAPEVPTSAGTVAVAAFYQAVQAGEEPAPLRHVALQVPAGLRRISPWWTSGSWPWPTPGAWPSTCGPSRRRREMEHLCGLGVDGIITDRPTALVGVLERLGCAWRPEG